MRLPTNVCGHSHRHQVIEDPQRLVKKEQLDQLDLNQLSITSECGTQSNSCLVSGPSICSVLSHQYQNLDTKKIINKFKKGRKSVHFLQSDNKEITGGPIQSFLQNIHHEY